MKKIEGAVTGRFDPYARVIRTPSPSANFIFGKTHGLPLGYSMLLWGPPGGGKSLYSNVTTGQLHRDDPEGIVVKIDTEWRDQGQMTPESAAAYGVDLERYVVFQVNKPDEVFDMIEQKIGAMVQDGAPIRLIIIDSINGIQGRRESAAESINQVTIGDHAQTMQMGLKQILPIQRRGNISLILCAQQRSQMERVEIMRGNTTKAAVSHGTQHHCEYFVYVEGNKTKLGRTDELGRAFENESHKDVTDTADTTGHKIRVWMQKSFCGPAGRSGEFTLSYKRGVINQHEEVFRLGLRWGIIKKINNQTMELDGKPYRGKPAMLEALAASADLQKFVIAALLEAEASNAIESMQGPAVSEDEVEFENLPSE